ncbi:low density lipoprotein receptor adapter protein 1-like isoform X2 [Venturia canescens]|uniref:low density lipoprotein receptor adapter protein 1-like isoform X2 n=1 Tax=Venturia canescens TaxID=32260 RepID=UPI001C9D2AB4|nr:low density lipoprotein receptor adapter protein 1-like isoform X2 [Venturia canescens]
MPFFKKLRIFSRHKKLCEEWALANSRECVEGVVGGLAGKGLGHEDHDELGAHATSEVTFALKYLGSTLVETPSNEEATAEAIKTVITMAKACGKKLQRVSLAVSLRGIRMTDLSTEEDHLQVSIYRISYCSADATHDHVFAFIATNMNETMECHAFLCPKRKMAQTVTLTVARAFNTAYEAWQLSQADPRIHHPPQDKSPSFNRTRREMRGEKSSELSEIRDGKNHEGVGETRKPRDEELEKNLLIDLSNESEKVANSWVCFEEENGNLLTGKKITKKSVGNSIPMTAMRQTSLNSTPSHHVVPRPTPGFKVQNAWGESHSVNLMCS